MGSFWLQVKEHYVIENFGALVKYLSSYKLPSDGSVDSDFESTYTCLRKVAREQCQKARLDTNLFKPYTNTDNIDLPMLVRLLAASILTAHHFKHTEDYELMLNLANILLINKHNMSTDNCEGLLEFTKSCIEHRSIAKLGLNWRSLDSSIDILATHLLDTQWDEANANQKRFFEGKGLFLIENDTLVLSPLCHDKYSRAKVQSVMSLPYRSVIKSQATDKLKATATPLDVVAKAAELQIEFSQFKPSTPKVLKEYTEGQTLPVRIERKTFGNIIHAASIDPQYKVIKGKINISSYTVANETLIHKDAVFNRFNEGDILVVKYQPCSATTFDLDKTVYNDAYCDYANYLFYKGVEADAIHVANFQGGTRWLTTDGILVNVSAAGMSEEEEEDLCDVIRNKGMKRVSIKNVNTSQSGNSIINGRFVSVVDFNNTSDDDSEASPQDVVVPEQFRKDAMGAFLNDFHIYCQGELDELPKAPAQIQIKDPIGLITASRTLYQLSLRQDTTMDRVKVLTYAMLLSECCGEETLIDSNFMQHELKYLECCIKFVRGENPVGLSLRHAANLEGVAEVTQKERIVDALSVYRIDDGLSNTPRLKTNAEESQIENIGKLVEASNILRGKIQDKSLARIKAEIATQLEMDDEYIPEGGGEDQLTYYGVESDTLEFKSSIVFPPCNRRTSRGTADPENQRWVIIKTVCGFLNSHAGGELYIGVRDNGFACGIKDDIDKLFELGKIMHRNYDNYRNYLKLILDQSFQSFDRRYKGTDITNEYVTYDCVTNKEGLEIMRLRVSPFPFDAVKIADLNKNSRPDWVADAYIRTSGTTNPLSNEYRKIISDARHSR